MQLVPCCIIKLKVFIPYQLPSSGTVLVCPFVASKPGDHNIHLNCQNFKL